MDRRGGFGPIGAIVGFFLLSQTYGAIPWYAPTTRASHLAEQGHNAAMSAMRLTVLLFLGYSTVAATVLAGQAQRFQFSPGALLRAELDKTTEANKVKVGDVIVVKLTDDLKWNGGVLASRNSKIFGHITQATPRRGDAPSVLGIAFDKLLLKDGSEITFKPIIQAIGLPDAATGSDWIRSDGLSQGSVPGDGPGQVGGPGGTLGQPSGYYGGRMGGATPTGSAVKLSPNARGILGIEGASLSTGATQESVISSAKHNVKIESGAQMILYVQ